jgi:hypothetical protein
MTVTSLRARPGSWLFAAWIVLLAIGAGLLASDVVAIGRHPQSRALWLIPISRRLDASARVFAEDVAARLGPDAILYATRDLGRTFEGQLGVRLAYRGTPRDIATDTQWTILERGEPADLAATVTALNLRYVLIQTAQPRPRLWQVCVHGAPLVRSPLVEVDANSRYFFEVYAIDQCRPAAGQD